MQGHSQAYIYSTIVSESTQKDDFIVEFSLFTSDGETLDPSVKITKDFDELLDFLAEIDKET